VHPAYLWGVTAILLSMALIGPIAFSPPALMLLRTISPGR